MSIADSIRAGRDRRGIAFLPFLAAGFPSAEAFVAAIEAAAQSGADCMEIGFPFSDPIADGPVIQSAFSHALHSGIRVSHVFDAVREARRSVQTPLVAMVSYSIVYRFPSEQFFCDAKAAGFDAVLIPDLPPPEARAICRQIRSAGLDTVLLVAPTTAPARRREIADLCSGFVYYLSVSGVTGERSELPADLSEHLAGLKSIARAPVCAGFGISTPQHLAQLMGLADGAIVGSALVKRVGAAGVQPRSVANAVSAYCRELLSGVR